MSTEPPADGADPPLGGLVIAVTRPAHQAAPTCDALAAAGAEVLRFPVMDIVGVPMSPELAAALDAVAGCKLAIFVSANAVQFGLPWLRARGGVPKQVQVAAVGRATATALRGAGVEVDVCPDAGFDSEALLAAPALEDVRGASVVLFRGRGGRELLADTLRARGAKVHYAEVYRRARGRPNASVLAERWRTHGLDLIVVTSGDGLRFLCECVGPEHRQALLRTPLAVIGERMLQQARTLGFQSDIVVTAPGEQALVRALQDWRRPANRE